MATSVPPAQRPGFAGPRNSLDNRPPNETLRSAWEHEYIPLDRAGRGYGWDSLRLVLQVRGARRADAALQEDDGISGSDTYRVQAFGIDVEGKDPAVVGDLLLTTIGGVYVLFTRAAWDLVTEMSGVIGRGARWLCPTCFHDAHDTFTAASPRSSGSGPALVSPPPPPAPTPPSGAAGAAHAGQLGAPAHGPAPVDEPGAGATQK